METEHPPGYQVCLACGGDHALAALIELHLMRFSVADTGPDAFQKSKRELGRFRDFADLHNTKCAHQINDILLLRYANTWKETYPASSTRALVRVRLLQFLSFCVQIGSLRVVPTIPKIKQRREPTLPLTEDQYEKLLCVAGEAAQRAVTVPRPVRCAVILLMRWCGPSIADAIMMRRDSIVYDTEKRLYRCIYRRLKTGVSVNNPLPFHIAEQILEASKLSTSRTHLFRDAGKEELGTASKRRWTDWFAKTFARSGMPGGHSHQLRDTFAVCLLLQRVPLESVSRALGHTSIKTTEKYYAPWIKERQDLLDDVLIGAFRAALPPKIPPRSVNLLSFEKTA